MGDDIVVEMKMEVEAPNAGVEEADRVMTMMTVVERGGVGHIVEMEIGTGTHDVSMTMMSMLTGHISDPERRRGGRPSGKFQ